MILVVGLSHRTAPIEVRERLAVKSEQAPEFLRELVGHGEVSEAMVISTCNRVEVYAAAPSGNEFAAVALVKRALAQVTGADLAAEVERHLFALTGMEAVRHLFRVASSLDSLVVGEPQILGQVRASHELAVAAGTMGSLLGRAVESAFHAAKRARTETQVGAGSVSISSVAVELATQIFGALQGRVVALLGAGEMAEAAAKPLCSAGAKLRVVNRSPERAAAVASLFGGEPRPWTELQRTLIEADVVIASTSSSHFVLTPSLLSSISRGRKGRSLFLIDIAVPRDVDPEVNKLEGVYLYDIDDLSHIAAETMRERASEADLAENIVDEELSAFRCWLDGLAVAPTIVALRRRVEATLVAEMERSLNGKLKHLGPDERKALQGMVSAAVNKLTHAPSTRLKGAAGNGSVGEYVHALRHLFDLSDDEPPAEHPAPSLAPEANPEVRRSG